MEPDLFENLFPRKPETIRKHPPGAIIEIRISDAPIQTVIVDVNAAFHVSERRGVLRY
jgi:hypothetical protein